MINLMADNFQVFFFSGVSPFPVISCAARPEVLTCRLFPPSKETFFFFLVIAHPSLDESSLILKGHPRNVMVFTDFFISFLI